MRATMLYTAGDVRVEDAPDAALQDPTDAVVRVVRTCICGSDLHPYRSKADSEPAFMGHEFLGTVEEVGSEVSDLKKGDLVVAPFAYGCGSCVFCREGLPTSCPRGGFFTSAQSEAIRAPYADYNLTKLPHDVDEALLPSLLTLADVYGTGWHAAVKAGVNPSTSVTVIGDGAVGLLAVLSARQLGAEQIILMGRHQARTDLGREFGATDVVAERGQEGIERVRELTGGLGTHAVLEAVGHMPAYEQSVGVVRPGGVISRVGVPQYDQASVGFTSLFGPNVALTGGPAPTSTYVEQLLPGVLDGSVEPGKVFDRSISLEDTPEGYRAMDQRKSLKVLVTP